MWLLPALCAVFSFFVCAAVARPQIFVPDPISGYALGGRDPVAYYIDGKPRPGKRRYELAWGGVKWVFVNQGNRAAFENAPTAYAPVFGGCAVYSLSQGFATAGNPSIFAIFENRLMLFHSDVNRFLFLSNPKAHIASAQGNARRVGCMPGT